MTRNKACKAIARTNNMDELVEFFKHPNRHVRHAARFKAYRLAPEDQRVSDVISNIKGDVVGWVAATAAYENNLVLYETQQYANPPMSKPVAPEAIDPSYIWTYNAIQSDFRAAAKR